MHQSKRIAALILLAFFFATERAPAQPSDAPKSLTDKAAKTDLYGDPLPAGAIARLGTIRLRHGDSIHALAISPDGKRIASLGKDRILRLWDVASGGEQAHLDGEFQALAFAANGRTLTTTSAEGVLAAWDPRSEKVRTVRRFADGFYCSALSRDGTRLAVPTDGMILLLCDAATGEIRHRIKTAHTNSIVTLTFSSSGKTLASTSLSQDAIRVWDTSEGRQLSHVGTEGRYMPPLAFSADDKILAAGDAKGGIQFWEASSGKRIRTLGRHDAPVSGLAFTSDGRTLASSAAGGRFWLTPERMALWEVSSGKRIRTLTPPGRFDALALSPDDKLMAAAGRENTIRLFDLSNGKERFLNRGHGGPVETTRFTADGRGILTSASDGAVRLWDAGSGRQVRCVAWPDGSSYALACSPDGRTLAALTSDPQPALHLWDAVSGEEIRRWDVKGVKFYPAVAFALDGKTLVTGGDEGALSVWDVATGKPLPSLRIKSENPVTELAVSSDGRWLAARIGFGGMGAFGGSAKIHLWDLATGRDHSLRQQPNILSTPAFSPDGKTLAALEECLDPRFHHNVLHLWEVESGMPRRLKLKGVGDVSAFAFAPGGEVLATAESRRIRLWDIADGTELRHFDGHRGDINALAFSPDGRTLVSGSADTTALVWDVSDLVNGRKHRLVDLSPRQLDALWTDLEGDDTARAGESIWKLIAGRQTVAFLKEHLHPVSAPDARLVATLIADLDGSDFAVRQRATRQLEKLGEKAVPALRQARADHPSLEMRRRIEGILARQPVMDVRLLRAIEVLERIGDREARQVLQTLADGMSGVRLTQEAKALLRRLEKRPSRP